jgi:hypothetical protein
LRDILKIRTKKREEKEPKAKKTNCEAVEARTSHELLPLSLPRQQEPPFMDEMKRLASRSLPRTEWANV